MEEETHSTNTFYQDDRGGRFGLRHLGLLYYYCPPSRRGGGDKITIPWRDVHAVRQLPPPKATTTTTSTTTKKRKKGSLTLTISTKDGNTLNFQMKDEEDLDLIHKDICSRVRRANKRSVFRRTQHEMMMTAPTATTRSDAGFGSGPTTAFSTPNIISGMVPVSARSSQADLIASSINAIESETVTTPPHHHHGTTYTAYPERDSVTPDDLDRDVSASNSSILRQDSTAPDDVVS